MARYEGAFITQKGLPEGAGPNRKIESYMKMGVLYLVYPWSDSPEELHNCWLLCPCGCGHKRQIRFDKNAEPGCRHQIDIDEEGIPTLSASVRVPSTPTGGCGAHFFIKNGQIEWC